MQIEPSAKILVVDDMPAMRSILCRMLQELGFSQITAVEDGETAWEMLQNGIENPEEFFELIIADWNMPGMSGIELLRAIRSSTHTRLLPFLMVTSKGEQPNVFEATQLGVTDYIVKPFNGAQLGEKISAALRT